MSADQFEKAEGEFVRLKHELAAGHITLEQFHNALIQAQVSDELGHRWTIGAKTGHWYFHDGKSWVQADPYAGARSTVAAATPPPVVQSPATDSTASRPRARAFFLLPVTTLGLCALVFAFMTVVYVLTTNQSSVRLAFLATATPTPKATRIPVSTATAAPAATVTGTPTSTPSPVPIATATQTPLPTSTSTQTYVAESAFSQWRVAISDPFDQNFYRWPAGSDNTEFGASRESIVGGKYLWDISAKRDMVHWAFPSIPTKPDVAVTLDAKLDRGPLETRYGLFLRFLDPDNFYFFAVSDQRSFSFQMFYRGEWKVLIDQAESSAIRPGQVNTLMVLAQGSHFTFQINGQYVGETVDGRLESGRTGIAVGLPQGGRAIVEFDNFNVRTP